MCKTMQVIVDRERDDAEITRSKKIAWNMWKNGEHDLDKIAETTFLSVEQVREAITQNQHKGLIQHCQNIGVARSLETVIEQHFLNQ